MSEDDMIDEMVETLRFYADGFEPVIPPRNVRGVIYKPTESLLNDCGNKAMEILRKYDKVLPS
jgi:hypothetical protein